MKEQLEEQQKVINEILEKLKKEMLNVDILTKVAETTAVEKIDEGIKESVERVCDYFSVSVERVYRGGRVDGQVAKARKIISWMLNEYSSLKKHEIGTLYGKGWNHTSLNQYLDKVQDDLEFYRSKGKDINNTIKYLMDLNIPIR